MDVAQTIEARIRTILAGPAGLRGIPIPELNAWRRAVEAATRRAPAGFDALAEALLDMAALAEGARGGGLNAEEDAVLSTFLETAAGNLPETMH